MNNIVQTKRTPVAGRRPTGGMPGELYFNFADRTIGCVDENGNPVDIATAISVSALPPASPVAGQLWYRTAIPAGLYIWFVDADSAQWVQVAGGGSGGGGGGGGGGASVEIGDTPPASPVEGQFWFSTVEPVGLFIWFVDADSAQWVQVGGSSAPVGNVPLGTVSYFASPNPPPGWLLCNGQAITTAYPELRQYLLDAGSADFNIATEQQALAGTSVDTLMTPFLVRARQGRQSISAAGLTSLNLSDVPVGFTDLALSFNNLTIPANAQLSLDFAGTIGATYAHTRGVMSGSAIATTGAGGEPNFPLDAGNTGAGAFMGTLFLNRIDSQAFTVSGSLRRANTVLFTYAGRCILNNPAGNHFPRLNCDQGGFTSGGIVANWRM